jgi:hypothetical protein
MKYFNAAFLIVISISSTFGQTPSSEIQIKTALLAAPEDMRAGAMVYGYNAKGEFVVLRKGTNELVCLADDPKSNGLSVSCYHKDLEPFMARGRELKAAGKTFQEIFDMREAEAKSGKLMMPKQASNLQIYSAKADDYNAATGEVTKGNFRYVVYIPWATAASTGLPIKPEAPGMPWIMDPGTHRAHIMISPVSKD